MNFIQNNNNKKNIEEREKTKEEIYGRIGPKSGHEPEIK